ncbi:chromate resistance protein ChrB domain-containing protein [Hydrogenophaga sp.]|uniref:chromate resistance protein ChrB domain-containing protein n=1 Tax=Hydrogenophaga sp. TaxID=1904254 RepID=UPI003563A3B9
MIYGWILVLSLPTENATVRMRAWRTLKNQGAAVLRDGVYLMPDRPTCQETLSQVADDVRAGGGTARLMRVEEPAGESFAALFDRSDDYAPLLNSMRLAREGLSATTWPETQKQARKLHKQLEGLVALDFFPGEAMRQAQDAWQALDQAIQRAQSPDEPHMEARAPQACRLEDFQNRRWATRRRPRIDRLASAWLIRRFIDLQARFLWRAAPGDCPPDAVGFDFDRATFTHQGHQVTFEVLLASFGLEQAALAQVGALVHFLDVGGVQPPEAAGVAGVLQGLHSLLPDDDELLAVAGGIFDGLLASFSQAPNQP